MAIATHTHAANAGIADRVTASFKAAGERFAAYRSYRKTLKELSALSDRELNDLGLSGSMLRRVAYEAAYGK